MTGAKVCFVHVSNTRPRQPEIRLLPLGLPALADHLARRGFDPVIVHLALERSLDPGFDLGAFVAAEGFLAVLFDWHWHFQSYDVLQTVRRLKEALPGTTTVVGGFTASLFHEEIMATAPQIDFVVRGDAETPLLELLRTLERGGDLSRVPNLSWRGGAGAVHNAHAYVADGKTLDGLRFTSFELIRHHRVYLEKFSRGPGPHDRRASFFYVPGRGCTAACSFCGGSARAQKLVNNRRGVSLASPEAVVRELARLPRYGIDRALICFEPDPGGPYYLDVFEKIRARGLRLALDFECYGVPTREFVSAFAATFREDSTITISPETGSDRVRRGNKGNFYTNEQLIEALDRLAAGKIKTYVAFIAGLAHETRDDAVKTLSLIAFLRGRFPRLEVHASVVAPEPASQWHLRPGAYGLSGTPKSLEDFCRPEPPAPCRTEAFSASEIEALRALYQAEARCRRARSRFLELLAGTLFALEYYDWTKLHERCRPCPRYACCFAS